ncbi:hypothetical protein FRC19_001348 [Serendipita sp. 401]|nr:hypothetical protein FRC19_001348 [Serendipita sp. 401]
MLGHGQSTTTPEINSFRASMTLAPLPIQANVDDIDYGCDIGIASFLPNSSPSTMCCRRGDIGSQVRAAQRLDSRDVLSSSASQAIRSAASFCSPLSPLSNVASCSGLALEIDRAWGYSDSDKFDQQLTDVAATSLNHPRDIQTHGYLNERQEFSTTGMVEYGEDNPTELTRMRLILVSIDFLGLSSVTTHVKFREFEDLHAIFRVSRKPDQESFLKGVLQSEFYYKDLMEPKENCRSTCRGSSTIGVGMGGSRDERSIYYRLVEKVKVKYKWWYKCCVCGELKSTSGRALGCVRSDLNHRPYVCQGSPMGCIKCPGYDGFAQFFTRALLVDHLKGQAKKVECVEWSVPVLYPPLKSDRGGADGNHS